MPFLRRLIYSIAIGASVVLCSCKAKEDIKLDERVLFPVPICTEADPELKLADQRQACIEDIIKEHGVPFIADIIYFHESRKERYARIMGKEYSLDVTTSKLWEGLKQRASAYASITMIPRELVGKQKSSVLIVFPSAFEKSKKKEDIISFVADHEGLHAADNANGITLCGKKITYEIITQMGSQRYQDIVELRAYENQLDKIHTKQREVSDECASLVLAAYFIVYTRVMNAGLIGNAYSLSAIQETKYLPIVNLETKEIMLLKKEPKGTEPPK